MKVTADEHNRALAACFKIRERFPDLPSEYTLGTEEGRIHDDLDYLNRLLGAHACNEHMLDKDYRKALAATGRWLLGEANGEIPVFVQESTPGGFRCTTDSGRHYFVVPHEGGFKRGDTFGATVADAMRGAQ